MSGARDSAKAITFTPGIGKRFNIYVRGDATPERHLHAMNINEKWPAKCAASCQSQDVADMDSQLIEVSLYALTALNAGDTSV